MGKRFDYLIDCYFFSGWQYEAGGDIETDPHEEFIKQIDCFCQKESGETIKELMHELPEISEEEKFKALAKEANLLPEAFYVSLCNRLAMGLQSKQLPSKAREIELPADTKRVETGAVRFKWPDGNSDWKALHIRGDCAFGYAMAIRGIKQFIDSLPEETKKEAGFYLHMNMSQLVDLHDLIANEVCETKILPDLKEA